MKAQDLRIGNYIEVGLNIKFESVYSIIEEISNNSNVVLIKDANILRVMPLDVINPIPLTEEWLLKFGFEKNEIPTSLKDFYIINYQLENFVVYLLESSFEIELINKSGEQFNLFINKKKQVHILQNLYFALTGKELKIIS
jgi:hypothetical protein